MTNPHYRLLVLKTISTRYQTESGLNPWGLEYLHELIVFCGNFLIYSRLGYYHVLSFEIMSESVSFPLFLGTRFPGWPFSREYRLVFFSVTRSRTPVCMSWSHTVTLKNYYYPLPEQSPSDRPNTHLQFPCLLQRNGSRIWITHNVFTYFDPVDY